MIRQPVVAGQFYPASKHVLERELSGLIQLGIEEEDVFGAVIPHAAYKYSGEVAGKTISALRMKRSIIIIGPNHTGRGDDFSLMCWGWWKTPLGDVQVLDALARDLTAGNSLMKENLNAHKDEHSIEVILPMLQYKGEAFKIIPIAVANASLNDCKKVGEVIAATVQRMAIDPLVIASSDMTHYESIGSASAKDRIAIDAILKMDEDMLYNRVREKKISMCGVASVCIMLACTKKLGATHARLIHYATSGDKTGEMQSVVGYSGILIK